MLLRPIPLPDELDRSYLGRVMRMNGKTKYKETLNLIAGWAGCKNEPGVRLPAVELLSMVAGAELQDFVCHHTTVPLWRSITSSLHELPHGDKGCRGLLQSYGMWTTRSGAYFCPDCVQDDLYAHGISYWYRKLQLPGLFWCPKHHIPLCYVDSKDAFLLPPHTYVDTAKPLDKQWVKSFQNNKEIQMFINISFELIERKAPLYSKSIALEFKKKLSQKKLRNFRGNRKNPLFSDLVLDLFDQEWLALTFPVIEHKKRGERMYQLDGLFYGKKAAPSATAFILAAVVLFDTVDDAIETMLASNIDQELESVDDYHRTRLDDDELRASYIHYGGDHAAVAEDVQRNRLSVAARLNTLGLPNLAIRDGITQDFIEAFLVEGKPLSESMKVSGIDERGMERVLRILSVPFSSTMKYMKKSSATRGTINRKARSRVPHEINKDSVLV
ncbi:MAG: TniQ family protein [Candidatus Thiodiazotropha endolucinida]